MRSQARDEGARKVVGVRVASRGVCLGMLLVGLAAPAQAQPCPTAPCSTDGQCDDNNYCTFDQCIGTVCDCSLINDDQCIDANFCDGQEYCDPGVGTTGGEQGSCQEGTPIICTQHCSGGVNYGQTCTTDGQCQPPADSH